MQRLKLLGTILTACCLVIGTIASAEPATKPAPKKHPQCEGSKVKTACNQQLDVKEFVTGLQAPPPTPQPTVGADQTANSRKDVQPANEDGAQTQSPQ